MKFNYRSYADPTEPESAWIIYRPAIPVVLRSSRKALRKFGIVDTGADLTLAPLSVAHSLGVPLDPRRGISIEGIGGGDFTAIPGELDLEIHRGPESLRWKALVHFAEQDNLLLGNEGFLEFFVATFDWAAKTIDLAPNSTLQRHA